MALRRARAGRARPSPDRVIPRRWCGRGRTGPTGSGQPPLPYGRVRISRKWPSGLEEVDAAAAVVVVDLARPASCRVGPVVEATLDDAAVDGVEVAVVDQEGVVLRCDLPVAGRAEVERDAVGGLHLPEVAEVLWRVDPEHLGEPAGRGLGVAPRHDGVVELDGHAPSLPTRPADPFAPFRSLRRLRRAPRTRPARRPRRADGPGPGACPRAWPARDPSGWRAPPRRGPRRWAAVRKRGPPRGSAEPSSPGAVCTVNSEGVIESRSSQPTGNDTGTPGRTRGLYAGRHCRATDAGGVHEDLPAPVVLHERRRGRARDRGARRAPDGPGGGGRVLHRDVAVDRHDDVYALGTTRLDRALQPGVGQRLADEVGGGDRHRERVPLGRVEVEHEVRHVLEVAGPDQRRVVLDGPLVGEPEECGAVVAERIGDVPM